MVDPGHRLFLLLQWNINKDEIDVNQELAWCYKIDNATYYKIGEAETRGKTSMVTWTLYADNVKPKYGSKAFYELQNF
jgi:hypothetical protein